MVEIRRGNEGNSENKAEFSVGDKVCYSGKLYRDSFGSGAGKTVEGVFTVSQYIKDRAYGVLLDVNLGWVQPEKCKVDGNRPAESVGIKLGDVVSIRKGATAFYDGTIYAEF